MRILLVYPPISLKDTYSKVSFAAPIMPPLGLAYIAAVLEQNNFDVKIIDCVAEKLNYEDLLKRVNEYKPSIIGFNANTSSYSKAQKTINKIKHEHSDIITVIGGAHASAMPKKVLTETPSIDIVLFGEGEDTFLEIANKVKKNENLKDIDGTGIRQNNRVIINKERNIITSLDKIPFPARHLLKNFMSYSHTPIRSTEFIISVITSRGCPFNCYFCDQTIFTKEWRSHSTEYILQELKMLKNNYGDCKIVFEDDNFALSEKRTTDICKKMIKDKLNLKWSCCIRADKINGNTLKLMKRAGCEGIYIGIESGNHNQLKLINKNLNINQIIKCVHIAKKVGIKNIHGSFIIGLPKDNKNTIKQTINLACQLPLTGATFNLFVPYPNTKLRDIASEFGTISPNLRIYSDHANFVPYIPNSMTEQEILAFQRKAYRKFYLRLKYIFNNLKYVVKPKFIRNVFRAIAMFFNLNIKKQTNK